MFLSTKIYFVLIKKKRKKKSQGKNQVNINPPRQPILIFFLSLYQKSWERLKSTSFLPSTLGLYLLLAYQNRYILRVGFVNRVSNPSINLGLCPTGGPWAFFPDKQTTKKSHKCDKNMHTCIIHMLYMTKKMYGQC